MTDISTYFRRRAPLVVTAGVLGFVSTLGSHLALEHSIEGTEQALSEKFALKASAFTWGPSGGLLQDYLWGRPLLFEGRAPQDAYGNRDIFRTVVRLSPEGSILDIRAAHNLTGTTEGDEFGLTGNENLAFFATESQDSPPSVTFLNLHGETSSTKHSLVHHLQLGVARYLETGSWWGLGRSDLLLRDKEFADTIIVSVKDEKMSLQAGRFQAQFDSRNIFTRSPFEEKAKEKIPLQHFFREREAGAWLHFAANSGRHIFGTGAVAWAEGRFFSLWDHLHRLSYSVSHPALTKSKKLVDKTHPELPTLGNSSLAQQKQIAPPEIWPPKDLPRDASSPKADGIWRPVHRKVLPSESEPLFYRTVLHTDPMRPYASLHLVAMDMRRLTLGIGAGYEDPHPDTGPPGSGHVPLDKGLSTRIVATFNGAFKAVHGRYGMKAEGRLLVGPITGAATVGVDASGQAMMGTWQPTHSPTDFAAFRQNLEPLVEDGIINPSGRTVWGDHLYGSGVAVERSALCLHESGQLLYGWATEATGLTLAAGMKKAGCLYAMHLDMNPGHCAFLFNRVHSVDPLKAEGETLAPQMQVNATRFLRWSPKDFFYLVRRNEVPTSDSISWNSAPGKLPTPSKIPGIFSGLMKLGGLSIHLDRVDAGRLYFEFTAGSSESKDTGNAKVPAAALIAWGLGHRTRGNRTGLIRDARVLVPLDRSFASLIARNGRLQLLPPGEVLVEEIGQSITQLPVLARGGALTSGARQLGGKRGRTALCLDNDNNLYIARMLHDTAAPLAQTLLDLGCSLVVGMDRGSRPPPLVERAGTDAPPVADHEQTMLVGTDTMMRPRTSPF